MINGTLLFSHGSVSQLQKHTMRKLTGKREEYNTYIRYIRAGRSHRVRREDKNETKGRADRRRDDEEEERRCGFRGSETQLEVRSSVC